MKYTYIAAWGVSGGISLPEKSAQIELVVSANSRFLLTRDTDTLLERIDEAAAIGRLLLKGLVSQQGSEDFQTALSLEVEEIKAERNKKVGVQPVLVFQAQGEIEAKIGEPFNEQEKFIVSFDSLDKSKVKSLHQKDLEAMKLAVGFESESPSYFAYLADGVYLLNSADKPVYSFAFSMSAEATVSRNLTEEAVANIAGRYAALKRDNSFDSVERHFSQMAEVGADRLKAFLSGWAALEIFIAKSFKSYEHSFLYPFTKAEQSTLRERFLERIKGVMQDKYRLTDKFIAVTAVLFPEINEEEAEKNYNDFCTLKSLRDSILHGESFSEKDLPVHEIAALLRKYVVARISIPNKVFEDYS